MKDRMIDKSTIGMVSILMGIAVVDGPDGLTRFLSVGSELHADETVRVPGDGSVEIRFLDGSQQTVTGGSELHLDPARWQASEMPLDPEVQQILDMRDVLQDTDAAADLSLWLPAPELNASESGIGAGVFPLNQHDPDLPGWYAGLGEILTAQDYHDDFPLSDSGTG